MLMMMVILIMTIIPGLSSIQFRMNENENVLEKKKTLQIVSKLKSYIFVLEICLPPDVYDDERKKLALFTRGYRLFLLTFLC